MFDSLRARLIVWYTAMFAVVVAAFGLIVGYLVWRARVAEIDVALGARAAAIAAAIRPATAGTFDLRLPGESRPSDGDDWYHAVWTVDGALIDRSDASELSSPPPAEGVRTREGRRELVVRASSGPLVLVGRPLDGVVGEVRALLGFMAMAGGAALIVTLAGGAWLVRRALLPVDRIGRTAHAMIEGDLAARIPTSGVETELEQMASALNAAFDRLQESVERQRRFTADASHEFRTPLATMATEIDWALARERDPAELRRALEVCRRAAARMHGVAERLLALARAEAPEAAVPQAPMRIDQVARDVVADLRPLADARELQVEVTTAPVTVVGDREALREAITNVVANAIGYNVERGRVWVEARREGADAFVTVRDTGVGIDPEDLPRVFEPFFRADPARSRARGGSGLGLAVAHAVVVRHGGGVTCRSAPGEGTTVEIRLRAS